MKLVENIWKTDIVPWADEIKIRVILQIWDNTNYPK